MALSVGIPTSVHRRIGARLNAQATSDPTRSLTLRAQFIRAMNRRWDTHRADMRTSIVENDCFGIQPNATPTTLRLVGNEPAGYRAFDFPRNVDKVDAFIRWLDVQQERGILELVRDPRMLATEQPWTNTYIDTAYQKGIRQGRADLRASGVDVLSVEEFAGFSQPLHSDRVAEMYMRTFNELRSVTSITNQAIQREIAQGLSEGLAQGLAEGKNPRTIARELYKRTAQHVDKIGKVRCRMIARTEILRSHNAAALGEYELAERQTGLIIKAEWMLSANPCPVCVELEAGGPYKIQEARGLIPAHPNCACAVVPLVEEARSAAAEQAEQVREVA